MPWETAISEEESARETVDIAPEGDVVFIVGPTQRRLKAHSLFVKTASPVLNAMLGPDFGEGQRLAKTGSVEIALPEDDADAMETIFNIMHCRNEKVRKDLKPDELLRVVIAGDKYDCFASLTLAVRFWINRIHVVRVPTEMWDIALAACLFGLQKAFAEATAVLIFYYPGSYLNFARKYEKTLDRVLLLNIAAMLEGARNQLRMKVLTDMLHVGRWPDCLNKFIWDAGDLGHKSLADFLQVLSQGDKSAATGGLKSNTPRRGFRDITAWLAAKKYRDEGGLCVWCVRTGKDHKLHEPVQEER